MPATDPNPKPESADDADDVDHWRFPETTASRKVVGSTMATVRPSICCSATIEDATELRLAPRLRVPNRMRPTRLLLVESVRWNDGE